MDSTRVGLVELCQRWKADLENPANMAFSGGRMERKSAGPFLDREPDSENELTNSDFDTASPLTLGFAGSQRGKRLYFCVRAAKPPPNRRFATAGTLCAILSEFFSKYIDMEHFIG
jgi:hypothetical protein